jgi:hypothetical protein
LIADPESQSDEWVKFSARAKQILKAQRLSVRMSRRCSQEHLLALAGKAEQKYYGKNKNLVALENNCLKKWI